MKSGLYECAEGVSTAGSRRDGLEDFPGSSGTTAGNEHAHSGGKAGQDSKRQAMIHCIASLGTSLATTPRARRNPPFVEVLDIISSII